MTDHSPESRIEGPSAVPASSPSLAEVPFPAEYTRPTPKAGGQHGDADRRMTYDESVAALQDSEGLIDSAYSVCSETIAAFEKDGPGLVGKAQERLRTYCLPESDHDEDFVAKAQQVEIDIERWLPYKGQFAPLLALVSGTTDTAVTVLMADAINKIKALPFYRTGPADSAAVMAMMLQISKDFNSLGDDTDEDAKAAAISRMFATSEAAGEKIRGIDEDLAKTSDFLNTMAECGFLVGVQVAATFQTIAGYIEARRTYLITYLEATDYFRESDNAKEHIVRRAVAIQALYDGITTAVGQYAPLILPKVFAQVPLIGGGFAILDVARTVNEKRKLVEERKRHILELAEAHQGRGSSDEMSRLARLLRNDRADLKALVTSTVEMCQGLITLARSAQADPLGGTGS